MLPIVIYLRSAMIAAELGLIALNDQNRICPVAYFFKFLVSALREKKTQC